MPASFLEIIELPDGSIVLRRSGDQEALVTLAFSPDAKVFLQGKHLDIAKAMMGLGLKMAGHVVEGTFDQEDSGFAPRILH